MWHGDDPKSASHWTSEWLLLAFHVSALTTAISLTRFIDSWLGLGVALVGTLGMLLTTVAIDTWCPRTAHFGGSRGRGSAAAAAAAAAPSDSSSYFSTPLVPYWPCLGCFVNWYLIAQLDFVGCAGLLVVWMIVIVYYCFFAVHHSIGGKQQQQQQQNADDGANDDDNELGPIVAMDFAEFVTNESARLS